MQSSDDRELLTALLDAAIDGIVISDSSGRILRANKAAGVLFGRPVEELIGADLSILMPKEVGAKHQEYVERYLSSGTSRIIGRGREVEGMRKDGTTFPLHVALGRADIGDDVAFVAMLHDLTNRRAAEEAAARSQRMDAIGRMTGGIAHDFNNLLTVVIGNLELLSDGVRPDRTDQLIADALAAAELGADLTSRLMMFARKKQLNAEIIDLNEAVANAVALLKHTLSARCQLELSAGPRLWPVQADPTQLQTAILNLALNSQDAMPKGGRLFLETSNIEIDDRYLAQEVDVATGRYVRLSVSDTGEGMNEEQRAHALEPFFTTKPVGEGTGLGLSMVYGFTRQSGGHVTLYSEPGQGTTVSLYFPAVDLTGADSKKVPLGKETSAQHGHGRTILIVEDDVRVRKLSETRLAALGFHCIGVSNADSAWKIVNAQEPIDLVFTDMVMPGKLSGYDLAKRIAAQHPGLPVLITSGFSESVLRDQDIGSEFVILRKPYRQADLAEAVYNALARS